MSLTITTDVFCDKRGCGNWVDGITGPRTDAKAARAETRRHGWKITRAGDLCPHCAHEEKTDD